MKPAASKAAASTAAETTTITAAAKPAATMAATTVSNFGRQPIGCVFRGRRAVDSQARQRAVRKVRVDGLTIEVDTAVAATAAAGFRGGGGVVSAAAAVFTAVDFEAAARRSTAAAIRAVQWRSIVAAIALRPSIAQAAIVRPVATMAADIATPSHAYYRPHSSITGIISIDASTLRRLITPIRLTMATRIATAA